MPKTLAKRILVLAAMLALFATCALAAPKVETIAGCVDPGVPDSVKKVLSSQGYRVSLDDGSTVDLCPRAEVASATKTREDASYALVPSAFIGVVHFAKNTRDYRGDSVTAGSYNLRYALQPSDGNHLGTSPTPDFLLLVPYSSDADPDKTYSFEQLVDLSQKVTGKKHPAALNLVSPDAKSFPSVTTDFEDHTILYFKMKTSSGELPLGLVVKGTTTE
jgi:hypothetical protein